MLRRIFFRFKALLPCKKSFFMIYYVVNTRITNNLKKEYMP